MLAGTSIFIEHESCWDLSSSILRSDWVEIQLFFHNRLAASKILVKVSVKFAFYPGLGFDKTKKSNADYAQALVTGSQQISGYRTCLLYPAPGYRMILCLCSLDQCHSPSTFLLELGSLDHQCKLRAIICYHMQHILLFRYL